MENAQFTSDKKNPFSIFKRISVPNLNFKKTDLAVGENKNMLKPKINGKSLWKGLGTTGVVIAVVLLILSLVSYIFLIRPGIVLVKSVNVVKADASRILEAVRSRDLVTLETALNDTDAHLNQLRKDRGTTFGWTKNIGLFKLNEFYQDSDRFINAGFYATSAMREVATIVTPFADVAGLKVRPDQELPQTEGLREAFQSWVTLMPDVATQMDGVIEKLSKIGEEIAPINTAKYPKKVGKIVIRENIEAAKSALSNFGIYAPDVKQALTIFPRLLGVNVPMKRYMIIMQNDKEIRATGGFMTNYATFKLDNAWIASDFTSKDMYSIDNTLDLIDYNTDFSKYTKNAPSAYHKYLKLERWYARDMNAFPDFVKSMDQFLYFYDWAGRVDRNFEIKPVNGVIAIDTNVISELLDITGPVTVNGVTYDKDNVVLELENIASLQLAEQVGRKKVLGDLMEAMLTNVFESDKNLWPKLIEKGVDLAMRKHIQVYFPGAEDADAQALVEKYGFGGRVKENVEGDYFMAVQTNLGGDKTNWFVDKQITHKIEKSNGRWMSTVTVKYTYNQPGEAYAAFAKGFKDWLRIYVPLGSEAISVEGTEDGTETGEESGKTYFTSYVQMGPGESKEVIFKYYLPENTIQGDKYKLTIQKQGGVKTEPYSIVVNGKKQDIELKYDTVVNISL